MGRHTGLGSGSRHPQNMQQLTRCCLRLTWSPAAVCVVSVTAKSLDIVPVCDYRAEGRDSDFFLFSFFF